MLRLNRHTNNKLRLIWLQQTRSRAAAFYLQISYIEGPDLLFVLNLPDLDQPAHVARRHQGGVVAEHGTRDGVFVACGDALKRAGTHLSENTSLCGGDIVVFQQPSWQNGQVTFA